MESAVAELVTSQGRDHLDGPFQRWALNHRQLARKTIRDYLIWLLCADRWFQTQGRALVRASEDELQAFVDTLKSTASLRNNVRSALLAFFDSLIAAGYRQANPATSLPRWREPKRLPRPITHDQAVALVSCAFRYRPMFGSLVALYLLTGLRASELSQRRWGDLVGDCLFYIRKGGDQRCKFLSDDALAVLAWWRQQCPSPTWIFPSPRGNAHPISRHWVYDKIRDLGDAAGIDNCNIHRLRHTHGTDLLDLTDNILLVKESLDHDDIKNTMIYARLRPTRVREALACLDYGATRTLRPEHEPTGIN